MMERTDGQTVRFVLQTDVWNEFQPETIGLRSSIALLSAQLRETNKTNQKVVVRFLFQMSFTLRMLVFIQQPMKNNQLNRNNNQTSQENIAFYLVKSIAFRCCYHNAWITQRKAISQTKKGLQRYRIDGRIEFKANRRSKNVLQIVLNAHIRKRNKITKQKIRLMDKILVVGGEIKDQMR